MLSAPPNQRTCGGMRLGGGFAESTRNQPALHLLCFPICNPPLATCAEKHFTHTRTKIRCENTGQYIQRLLAFPDDDPQLW